MSIITTFAIEAPREISKAKHWHAGLACWSAAHVEKPRNASRFQRSASCNAIRSFFDKRVCTCEGERKFFVWFFFSTRQMSTKSHLICWLEFKKKKEKRTELNRLETVSICFLSLKYHVPDRFSNSGCVMCTLEQPMWKMEIF